MENPFKWRHFQSEIILICVQWYLRYVLSYRNLKEMMSERGLSLNHTIIFRWVQDHAPEIEQINAIENERLDDIPLLLAIIKQIGIIDIFNEKLGRHGNWEGLAAGYIIAVWLAYILSEGDHRKSYLQKWVAEREHTLRKRHPGPSVTHSQCPNGVGWLGEYSWLVRLS